MSPRITHRFVMILGLILVYLVMAVLGFALACLDDPYRGINPKWNEILSWEAGYLLTLREWERLEWIDEIAPY